MDTVATASIWDVSHPRPPEATLDHPGRWLGGVIGAGASILVTVVAVAFGEQPGSADFVGGFTGLGVLGVPVGFVLGRQFLPLARSAGWRGALSVGLLVGLAAPPLGAVELMIGSAITASVDSLGTCGAPASIGYLFVLPFAMVVSFVAVIATVPAGIAWGLLARALPDAVLVRARMPRRISWLSVRHLAAVGAIAFLALLVVQVVTAAPCPAPWALVALS